MPTRLCSLIQANNMCIYNVKTSGMLSVWCQQFNYITDIECTLISVGYILNFKIVANQIYAYINAISVFLSLIYLSPVPS